VAQNKPDYFLLLTLKEVLQTWWDWSRRYRSRYRTVSQTIVARCCNRWRTHWSPLWLMVLVPHVNYHTCVFCCIEIDNLDSGSKLSGLFRASLYIGRFVSRTLWASHGRRGAAVFGKTVASLETAELQGSEVQNHGDAVQQQCIIESTVQTRATSWNVARWTVKVDRGRCMAVVRQVLRWQAIQL